jgi:chromosome segregation ATPase
VTTEATKRAARERAFEAASAREKEINADLAIVDGRINTLHAQRADLDRQLTTLARTQRMLVAELDDVRSEKTRASTRELVNRSS